MIHMQHDPLLLKQTYLGPEVPVKTIRTYVSFSCNKAASYIPSCLFSSDDYFTDVKKSLSGRSLVLVENYVKKVKVDVSLLTQLGDDFKNHIETRAQILLMQLILVYKTQICFKLCTHADMQVGNVSSKADSDGDYAAAHSGTLPTLRLSQSRLSNTDISFAQNTSFYYGWNATTYLPKVANEVDSNIDSGSRHRAVNLRKTTTDILNQVASGEINPKKGLHDFLQALISVLQSLKEHCRDELKPLILSAYSMAAENYDEKMDNGYPLIQKLLLRPINESVDDVFYLSAQKEMHAKLKLEMVELQPKAVPLPLLGAGVNLRALQTEIGNKLSILKEIKPGQWENYVKICSLADAVRSASIQYFTFLHSLSLKGREDDLNSFLRIKTPATSLSSSAFVLYSEALKVIKTQNGVENPRNMDRILFLVLMTVSQNISHFPKIVATPLDSLMLKKNLKNQIERKITDANLVLTATASSYIKSSLTQRTHEVALRFFAELLDLPDSLKDSAIKTLLTTKTVKTLSSSLSPLSLEFYSEILHAIRIKTGNKDFKPQNMGLILCHLLLRIDEPWAI